MENDPKIYADAYQLAVMAFHRTYSFSKFLRPTLGRRLEESVLDLLLAVRLATTTKKGAARQVFLTQASEILDGLRIILQLSHDMKALPASGYAELSGHTAIVGRQIGGLLRHTKAGYPRRSEKEGPI